MKHAINGLSGTTLPQIPTGVRANPSAQAKPTRPFQTIEFAGTNSIAQPQIPQAVTTLNPSDRLPSLDANSILKKLNAQDAGLASTNDFSQGADRLRNSYATGEPAVASLKSANTQSTSLDQPETQNLTSSGPGTFVNVLA